MFTGSAVRVQAVQDLKLQERQEVGRRSLESGSQHPRSPARARKKEGRDEEEGSRRKIPKTSFTFFFFFLLLLFLYSTSEETIYYNFNFIFLFLVAGRLEPRTLHDKTPHYQSDGPHFESSKL
jgi:hypothetical protein